MLLDFFYILVIVLIGVSMPKIMGFKSKDTKVLRKLFFYHLLFAFVFYLFTKDGGGDAWGYWVNSKKITSVEFNHLITQKGTEFMIAFNHFFTGVLGMGFLANTFMYSLFGYIGLVCFYDVAIKLVYSNSSFMGVRLFPFLFFLPNIHFWSSGVGKDSLLFFCIGVFSYSFMNINRRILLIVMSLLLSFLVRPHITLFLTVSFGIVYLFKRKTHPFVKVFIFSFFIVGAIIILPVVMKFANIDNLDVDTVNNFSDRKSALLSRSHTGSSVDISSYPYPLKVFTFLFRPLFFDVSNIPSVIASFENFLFLILSVKVLRRKKLKVFKAAPFVIKGLFVFLIVGALAFSPMLGNLGIMLRMRNMFLPGMIIYILWGMSYFHNEKQVKLRRKI